MGYTLGRPELDKAYKLFTKLADQKKEIFEEDLVAILQDGFAQIPERLQAAVRWRRRRERQSTSSAQVTLLDTTNEQESTGTANRRRAGQRRLRGDRPDDRVRRNPSRFQRTVDYARHRCGR
jgi:hypothetical protein